MKILKISSLSVVLASIVLASGCASTGAKPSHQRNTVVSSSAPSTEFVADEMNGTISSVERSLRLLVSLERGDEGPRNPNPIGTTVAGASGSNKAPIGMPSRALPDSALGKQFTESQRVKTQNDLQTRVRLKWTGDSSAFLRELSNRVGFGFNPIGSDFPVVSVDFKDASVEEVLREVARQIEGTADIKVDVAHRRVDLIRK